MKTAKAPAFSPKSLNYYHDLTAGGTYTVKLDRDAAAAVLKSYDYGLEALTPQDRQAMDRVISSLKDQIWP